MFGQTLGDFQLTQAKLAQMALTIDTSALLVYRAAWLRDQGESVTREAAMAKWHASEGAQQVIDAAEQLFADARAAQGKGAPTICAWPNALKRTHHQRAIR